MHLIEQSLIEAGLSPIAGVDEAGRGACAGPLVIAGVILKDLNSPKLTSLRDSKELTEKQREALFPIIYEEAISVSVIKVSPEDIDKRGVHAANLDGMRRAVQGLSISPNYVLTDGYAIEGMVTPSLAIWKGDQVAPSISAASVIAKVTRDRIMIDLDTQYPGYGLAKHKGYITAAHTKALETLGVTEIHRKSYANIAKLLVD
ncbi:MAG: ribonuclease HII [Actinomycetales bacterium]|nr:ribonuclease HII [Actinomycetales bacterium]